MIRLSIGEKEIMFHSYLSQILGVYSSGSEEINAVLKKGVMMMLPEILKLSAICCSFRWNSSVKKICVLDTRI